MSLFQSSDALSRLVKLCSTIAADSSLLEELSQEIKSGSNGPITSMLKNTFKGKLLGEIDSIQQFMDFFFSASTITEIPITESQVLGVKCFFMPKNSIFPLHDHSNVVVCTGVLYGQVKYMTLNKVGKNSYCLARKGKAVKSNMMFCTKDYRNIHSILAVENSILLDIFMPNDEIEEFGLFEVQRKRQREFLLEKRVVGPHKRIIV